MNEADLATSLAADFTDTFLAGSIKFKITSL
jgi:hypothetical protein